MSKDTETEDEILFERELKILMRKYGVWIEEDSDEHNLVIFTNEDRSFYLDVSSI